MKLQLLDKNAIMLMEIVCFNVANLRDKVTIIDLWSRKNEKSHNCDSHIYLQN